VLFDQTRRFSVGNKKSKKSHKSLDLWDLTVHYLVSSAEKEGFEPTNLTAYISATLLSKFQIGNETVTIFRCWACPTLTAVCLPNFRVQRYGFLLKLANI
jgi:hypothetical protein